MSGDAVVLGIAKFLSQQINFRCRRQKRTVTRGAACTGCAARPAAGSGRGLGLTGSNGQVTAACPKCGDCPCSRNKMAGINEFALFSPPSFPHQILSKCESGKQWQRLTLVFSSSLWEVLLIGVGPLILGPAGYYRLFFCLAALSAASFVSCFASFWNLPCQSSNPKCIPSFLSIRRAEKLPSSWKDIENPCNFFWIPHSPVAWAATSAVMRGANYWVGSEELHGFILQSLLHQGKRS